MALWLLGSLAFTVACSDPPPLPGYVPDPEEYTVPADAAKVREVPGSPGSEAPVDHLLLLLEPEVGREVAESVAAAEGGAIVGQVPTLRFYQLKLPTETMEELLAAAARARLVPGVVAAGLDPVVSLSGCPAASAIDELPSDKRCPWELADYSPALTAFEEMRGHLGLHDVTLGIVDSPLDLSSDEFHDLRLISADHADGHFPDPNAEGLSHGTVVAQIVAGDDDQGINGINGIASRFLGRRLSVAYGSLPMDANVRATGSTFIHELRRVLAAHSSVVNLSLEYRITTSLPAMEYAALKIAFEQLVTSNPEVLFVVAAGNRGIVLDGESSTPAGLQRPNVLTVGSYATCDPSRVSAPCDSHSTTPAPTSDHSSIWLRRETRCWLST